jgi:hypothetical protein
LQVHSAPVLTNVRYAPKATASRRKATRRYGPTRDERRCSKITPCWPLDPTWSWSSTGAAGLANCFREMSDQQLQGVVLTAAVPFGKVKRMDVGEAQR